MLLQQPLIGNSLVMGQRRHRHTACTHHLTQQQLLQHSGHTAPTCCPAVQHQQKASPSRQPPSSRMVAHAEPAGGRDYRERLKAGGPLYSPTSPQAWDVMRQALAEAGVKMVSPQELVFAMERGTVTIVDVRPEKDYEKGHLPDALNVPFYRPITGWEPLKVARRLGYAAFGVLNGTEINPEFANEVRAIMESEGPEKMLVLYCSQGGVLESTEQHKRGWQTRSLVAAYDLLQDGVSNVQVLRDGYTGWTNAGRDIEVFEFADEGTEELAA